MPEENSATDVNPMDALDFNEEDTTTEVDTQPTAEDSSTEETNDETTDQQETESTEDDSNEESDDTDETDDGESKPKNSAQNRIRSLANENRELRRQVEQLNAQAYQAQTAEQLQEEGMSETDAKIEALRQEQVIERANTQITALNSDLNMEAMQVTHDFPIFDPDSKEYNKDFAEMVAQEYMNASGMSVDPNTNLITQARVLPYDFYKSYARTYELGQKKGAIAGKRDYERTANAADVTPIASPKEEKKDPLMDVLLAD